MSVVKLFVVSFVTLEKLTSTLTFQPTLLQTEVVTMNFPDDLVGVRFLKTHHHHIHPETLEKILIEKYK